MNKNKRKAAIEYIKNHTDSSILMLSATIRYLIVDIAVNIGLNYDESWEIVEEYFKEKHREVFENIKSPSLSSYEEHTKIIKNPN